jgi:NADH-quinone oxidoreductase subunit F
VDLHLIPGAVATNEERVAIDAAIGRRRGIDHSGTDRHLLLPVLQAAQACAGWVSEGALNYICAAFDIPPAEAYGVASFYALLSTTPRPARIVHVCDDIACLVNGADKLCGELTRRVDSRHLPPGRSRAEVPTGNGASAWLRSPCLGQCERGPAAFVQLAGPQPNEWTLTEATTDLISAAIDGQNPPAPARVSIPQAGSRAESTLRLLRRVGVVDPTSLDDYRAHGGYAALRRAFALGPEGVIRELIDSKLVGRGGAAFSTGRKWDAVARAPVRPHYLVCNADESEPGTFKDRILMEEDPFALVEAMTICGYATGCERGFVYIRGEYPLATARVQSAIEQARARGFLGDKVLGADARFEIEVRRGAGAYICGEETALFNSIEGRRGEPRNKPPFPVQSGLFGKPTVVNNVETLANVLDIVIGGGAAFAAVGTSGSTGTKLFCLSGCVQTPGLYEVPFGMTLGQLIDLAGGVRDGRPLQAALLGGAAGMFVDPHELDVPLTFEDARAAGITIGSGVVMLFDDRVDLAPIVLRIAAFFRDESCGQCVPCRVGTVRQEEALHRLAAGKPIGSPAAEATLIDELAQVMGDASICGLGQTASSAVQTALRKLRVFAARGIQDDGHPVSRDDTKPRMDGTLS